MGLGRRPSPSVVSVQEKSVRSKKVKSPLERDGAKGAQKKYLLCVIYSTVGRRETFGHIGARSRIFAQRVR